MINYNDASFPSYIHDGYVYSGCTWEKVPHFHKDIELLSVHSSCMGYSVNGTNLFLEKGDILFVNSDQLHYSYATPPREGRYIIAVMHPRILCSNFAVEAKAVLPVISNNKVPYIHFKNGDRDAGRMQELMFELHRKGLGNEFMITKIFFEIWEVLMDRINESGDFSADVQYNQGNSIFNKYTNMTPIEYIMHFRVRKVADLLQSGDLSMSEIAERTGFSNASYMAETFKKFYRFSPREYKKSMQQ